MNEEFDRGVTDDAYNPGAEPKISFSRHVQITDVFQNGLVFILSTIRRKAGKNKASRHPCSYLHLHRQRAASQPIPPLSENICPNARPAQSGHPV